MKLSQEKKVKLWLEEANDWLSTSFFEQYMTTSAFHRAIWNLENKMGVKIEHGDKDSKGFKTYRIKSDKPKALNLAPFQPRMFKLR